MKLLEGMFDLRDELEQLCRLCRVDSPAAVVLFSGRILEGIAGEAAFLVDGKPKGKQVYTDLGRLWQAGVLTLSENVCVQNLRLLSNAARHIQREITRPDAEASIALVDKVTRWFCADFVEGPRMEDIQLAAEGLELPVQPVMIEILSLLDSPPSEPMHESQWQPPEKWNEVLYTSPVFPSLLAEHLINGKRYKDAERHLKKARGVFRKDLRLRQLLGLALGRMGRLNEALDILIPIAVDNPKDGETIGIMAAIYKKRWQAETDGEAAPPVTSVNFADALKWYRQAWDESDRTHHYSGINVAALAVMAGEMELALETARLIDGYFEGRKKRAIVRKGEEASEEDCYIDYWPWATHAEALLILGRFGEAAALYNSAFAKYEQDGLTGTTKRQLRMLLKKVAPGQSYEEFIGRP